MNNLVTLIGRLARNVETIEENKAIITLAVQRNYKNEEGIYEVDFIPCVLWNSLGDHTKEYCRTGDLVGIKGRIQMIDNKMVLVAEKVSFLAMQRVEEV